MDKRTPIDMQEFLNDISVPDLSGPLDLYSKDATHEQKDIFAIEKRKAWDKSVEARCDFTRRVRLTRRGDVFFISLWQKSLYGRTLTDIKGDDSMVDFFADSITPLIRDILGEFLNTGSWCVVTTPKRRHLVKNFATRISEKIAALLHIGQRTYSDYETGKTRIPVDRLLILAKYYNVSMDYITGASNIKREYPKK